MPTEYVEQQADENLESDHPDVCRVQLGDATLRWISEVCFLAVPVREVGDLYMGFEGREGMDLIEGQTYVL